MFARHISDDKRDNIRKNTIIDSELQVKMMYEFFGKVQIPLSELCQLETLIPLINPGDKIFKYATAFNTCGKICLLYTSPSPRDQRGSRMPSSA